MNTNKIISVVCDYYGVRKEDVWDKCRKRQVSIARQISMYLLREIKQAYFCDISAIFNRHHATIIHGYDTIAGLIQIGDKKTIREVTELTEIIKREEGEIIEGVIGDNDNEPLKQAKRKIWRSKHHHNNVKKQ
jgi:chromosomal replication initiator protein